MATRAPKPPTRPAPATRGRSAGRGTTSRAVKKKAPPPPPPRKPSHDPFVILISWLFKTLAAGWMLIANAAGFAVRSVGRGARDLHPHHKRDGIGLTTFGVAIVLAASIWWRMGNPVGR